MSAAFIHDFAIVLSFAFVISLLFSWVRQPAVFGYMLTGVLIGPYVLQLVSDIETINIFAELGIILLMFTIGLKYNLKKLRKVGIPAMGVGLFEIFLMLAIGNTLGEVFGWSYLEAVYLGGVLAFSSTAVIIKTLMDAGDLRKQYAQLIMGILIIEDVGAIVLLTVLGSLSMVGTDILGDVMTIFFRVLVFFTITLAFGLKFLPSFIDKVKRTGSKEVLLLTSFGLCFALSAFSDYLGFSVALGAFMMGAIISESRSHREVEELTGPVRDIFSSMFFISIGMLVNPFTLKDFLPEIVLISILAVVGKLASVSLGLYLGGYNGYTSLSAGLGMIPRGEFSFIIAKLGIDQGVVGQEFYLITVAVALATTLIGPPSLASSNRLADSIGTYTPVKIKSFFKFLGKWLHAIGGNFKLDPEASSQLRKRLREIGINLLIIIIIYQGVVIASSYATGHLMYLWRFASQVIGLSPPAWLKLGTIPAVIGTILALPSFYLIIRNIQMVIDLSIEIAGAKFKVFGPKLVRDTLRNATYVMVALIFTLTLLPLIVSEAVGHGMVLDASIVIFIAITSYFFWRNIGTFHGTLHEIITETLLAEEESVLEDAEALIEALKTDRHFEIKTVEIPPGSAAVGQSIAETKLKTLTGATIVAIERGSTAISPRPTTLIKDGDILLLIGTEEEIESARKYLTVPEDKEEEVLSLERFRVPPGSQVAGKTLAGTQLRNLAGVTIIAIERGREVIRNPKPQNVIKEDDVLLVVGSRKGIENARAFLEEGGED